jgi:arylsulfatase
MGYETPDIDRIAKEGIRFLHYYGDDGLLVGMRQGDYKYVFAEQRSPGTMQVWAERFTKLRLQKILNLFQDPFERADVTSNTFWDWQLNQIGQIYGTIDEVVQFAGTFKEFPPRSIPPSFPAYTIMEETIDSIREAKRRAAEAQKPEDQP